MLRQFIQWLKETSNTPQDFVRSYFFFRKGIGVIGVAFPIVLVIGTVISQRSLGFSDSISAYYYSVMRNVFVGILCAIGVFLICYRYEHLDDLVSTLAGVFAVGVALFPTAPDVGATEQQMMIGTWHYIFAVGFFVTLAIFALWIFRKSDQKNPEDRTPEKQVRNKVYVVCGIAIIVCLVLIFLVKNLFLSGNPWLQPLHPVLWLESLAVWAFAFAWFVKGEALGILNDKKSGVLTIPGLSDHSSGKLAERR